MKERRQHHLQIKASKKIKKINRDVFKSEIFKFLTMNHIQYTFSRKKRKVGLRCTIAILGICH